jgi:hypothetical protein
VRRKVDLATLTPRNRLSGGLALGVLGWCIASPFLAGLAGLAGLTDVVRLHWWLPVAAYLLAVALNLPTPHVPRELVPRLDGPDGPFATRMGRGTLFGYGIAAAAVVTAQSVVITEDDPWVALLSGAFLPLQPAAWALLAGTGIVALRALAGRFGLVPAAWRALTPEEYFDGRTDSAR